MFTLKKVFYFKKVFLAKSTYYYSINSSPISGRCSLHFSTEHIKKPLEFFMFSGCIEREQQQ